MNNFYWIYICVILLNPYEITLSFLLFAFDHKIMKNLLSLLSIKWPLGVILLMISPLAWAIPFIFLKFSK